YARMWLAISDGQTIADPEYRKLIFSGLNSPQVAERSRLFQIAVGLPNTPLPITAEEWNTSSIGVQKFIGGLTDRVAGELRAASGALRDEASDEAGIAAVALLGLIVLAAAMLFLILRNLLSSLRTLRDGALHVADSELPHAVEEIRAG